MPKKQTYSAIAALQSAGISELDAIALRRISMTLRRWFEHECNGVIRRDEVTAIPYVYSPETGKRLYKALDRKTGALNRLKTIMARYPSLQSYVQGDPRGASLYVLRPGDLVEGSRINSCYTRGIVVY